MNNNEFKFSSFMLPLIPLWKNSNMKNSFKNLDKIYTLNLLQLCNCVIKVCVFEKKEKIGKKKEKIGKNKEKRSIEYFNCLLIMSLKNKFFFSHLEIFPFFCQIS